MDASKKTSQTRPASNGAEEKKSDIARREEEVLAFWKKERIFEKSLEKKSPKGEFVFYDGPPFATGLPHHGSLLSSVIKDVIPRYKTLRGYHVPRRWGWDCHGLPIESLVEKKLGLKTKKDIEKIGIATFNKEAQKLVLDFADDWKRYVDRLGRFVDFDNSYKTMDNEYIESVWWGLKQMHEKGLLYDGKKVLMYCTHCETPLAKAEIAMDNTYKDVTDEALTVKFKVRNPERHGLPAHSYLLAWTTTPWTLPGNVALAVGKDITYVAVKKDGENLFVAKERAENIDSGIEKLGKELVGLEYEPLYDVPTVKANRGKKYIVAVADFVTTAEGTGIVHIAPAYGEDDFALGQKEKLPVAQLLEQNGHYNNEAPELVRGKFYKAAEGDIREDLQTRGLLFAHAPHAHSYPHCYRCGTRLIYNAVASWFISIQKIKAKMLAQNEKVGWVPEHLKHGRFKNIVESAPDWTISRNRYWASPLPIWRGKKSKKLHVIGSVEELLSLQKTSGNRYFVMRHGKAGSNGDSGRGYIESKDATENLLTKEGEEAVRAQAQALVREEIDLIVTSPLKRAQQTARLVQEALKLPNDALMMDKRLQEVDFGSMNGKSIEAWEALFKTFEDRFTHTGHGGENYRDVKKRVGDFLFDVERRYAGKRILIVSHGTPIWLMKQVAKRTPYAQLLRMGERDGYPRTAEWSELSFVRYPRNEEGELDLHRPYIDEMQLKDEGGEELERVTEVVDCWVESASMPFAQHHYLGERTSSFNPTAGLFSRRRGYPADFIAEYIAQTRTWFYYMHAVGIALFNHSAFRNVVTTGTMLAGDGAKISKSKGNFTDPLILIERFGADAYRFHLMNSVIMQAEDLAFRDEDVKEAHNRVVGILANSFKFFELYKEESAPVAARDSKNILDIWGFSRLDETIEEVTEAFDAYDTPRVCRALRSFIEDYSTWYVRRSRDRMKEEGEDKKYALASQREMLLALARLVAPIMPFIAEEIHRGAGGKEESIHLSSWPSGKKANASVLSSMKEVRGIVSRALEARNKAGIKVRQPLAMLSAKGEPLDDGYLSLIRDEVNVKEVRVDPSHAEDVVLDTVLTDALREEGMTRDAIRAIQEKRKEEKLSISDRPAAIVSLHPATAKLIEAHENKIIETAQLKSLSFEKKEEMPERSFEVRLIR